MWYIEKCLQFIQEATKWKEDIHQLTVTDLLYQYQNKYNYILLWTFQAHPYIVYSGLTQRQILIIVILIIMNLLIKTGGNAKLLMINLN